MKNTGRLLCGGDSPMHAGPASAGYQPLKGFPRSLRIVIADDEHDTADTLKLILEDEGHDVSAVYRSKGVMALVRQRKPDVVILDISMPEVSGYELAKEIRRLYGKDHLLMIAISGVYKKETDKLLSTVVGFDHHLTKPCEPKDLLALLAPLAYPDR